MENIVNVKDWDRTLAFLIIEGRIYESENNHQDCLLDYLTDIGDEVGIRLSKDEDAYDEMFDELLDRTHNMKTSHDAYGFDFYECGDGNCILVAHDEETFFDNKEWAERWADEHDAKVGYYISNYEVRQAA